MKIRLSKYDKLWAKMVRERDGQCRKCGKKPPWVLQAHHILPRGRKATRLLLDNGITLCAWCHTLGDGSVHRKGKEVVIEIVGLQEYQRLEKLSLAYMSEANAIKEFELKHIYDVQKRTASSGVV